MKPKNVIHSISSKYLCFLASSNKTIILFYSTHNITKISFVAGNLFS